MKFDMTDFKIEEYKGGNSCFDSIDMFRHGLVAKATVNGVQNVIIGTPACHSDYCHRDIAFANVWGRANPEKYLEHMKTKDWAEELVKALEK